MYVHTQIYIIHIYIIYNIESVSCCNYRRVYTPHYIYIHHTSHMRHMHNRNIFMVDGRLHLQEHMNIYTYMKLVSPHLITIILILSLLLMVAFLSSEVALSITS